MRLSLAPAYRPMRFLTTRTNAVFDRYSEASIQAVMRSHVVAKKLHMKEINTDHVLVGLAQTDETIASIASVEKLEQVMDTLYPVEERAPFVPDEQYFSKESRDAFQEAGNVADRFGMNIVTPMHLFIACISDAQNTAVRLAFTAGIDIDMEKRSKEAELTEFSKPPPKPRVDHKALTEFCTDLNAKAAEGKIDPVIGRYKEIQRVIEIMTRRTKNNPLLIGKPGVGKTAIAEGLAYLTVKDPKRIPFDLRDKRYYLLDLASIIGGTSERGSLEKRLTEIIKVAKEDPDVVLFIDEIHAILGAGKTTEDGGMNVGNILKPSLARGELTCIGSTTLQEYAMYMEQDGAMTRRFQPVMVEETDEMSTIEVLRGMQTIYEVHHGCNYEDDALVAAVQLTNRYMPYRNQPDKAIDAMDEAGSLVRVEKSTDVTVNHVMRVVSDWSNIPISEMTIDTTGKISTLEEALQSAVIGQEYAVHAVAMAMARSTVGFRDPKRPIATFLFVGPTGVGKTELARALCRHWYGDASSMIRFDMSEFMDSFSISRLIGAPPGYVGYDEAGELTEAVRRQPYSIVLFDEVEKAHPDINNLFLQAMDEGRVTDAKGNTVSLKNCVIILTSNLGAGQDELSAVKRHFKPEFINRLDDVIVFESLKPEDIEVIAKTLIQETIERAAAAVGISVTVTNALRAVISEEGYSKEYGARPLRRAICKYIEDPLSDYILSYGNSDKTPLTMDWDGEVVELSHTPSPQGTS